MTRLRTVPGPAWQRGVIPPFFRCFLSLIHLLSHIITSVRKATPVVRLDHFSSLLWFLLLGMILCVPSPSLLRFRDFKNFVAGNLQNHFPYFDSVFLGYSKQEEIDGFISEGLSKSLISLLSAFQYGFP